MRVHRCFVYRANLDHCGQYTVDYVHFCHDITRGQTFRPGAAVDRNRISGLRISELDRPVQNDVTVRNDVAVSNNEVAAQLVRRHRR